MLSINVLESRTGKQNLKPFLKPQNNFRENFGVSFWHQNTTQKNIRNE